MRSSFNALVHHASDEDGWAEYLDGVKPEGWTWFNARGEKRRERRKSVRLQGPNERSLRKEELRRSLVGRQDGRYPLPPHDVPEGDLHIYTDGSAKFIIIIE